MLTKKKTSLLLVVTASIGFAGACCAENEVQLEKAKNDVSNITSLQRGAHNFVNYCYGCHSLQYVRFNRVGADLQLSDEQVIKNLMFTGERPTDKMQNAIATADAARWFGKAPPDLSLIARARGTDYLYTFLKSFYIDSSRPTGMNNRVLPGAAMPNVLWELQGLQYKEEEGKVVEGGDVEKHSTGLKPKPGSVGKLSPEEFDGFVRDTVNFLDYVGEPIQLERRRIG
ncbi:MAG TPA: cytochrome c1, partial [Steroidobacteraceae bacterium]|nr:cytochrome c1 [Steroidobacteraceae bacterium]